MIKSLIKLANHLDAKGLRAEANTLDSIINKMASKRRSPGSRWDPTKIHREHREKAEEHTGEAREVPITDDVLRDIFEQESTKAPVTIKRPSVLEGGLIETEVRDVFERPDFEPPLPPPAYDLDEDEGSDEGSDDSGEDADPMEMRLREIEERLRALELSLG